MKIFFSIVTMLILVSACNSDESERFVLDIDLGITVKDSEGNDLLDPVNPDSFKDGEIKLFYLLNGEPVEYFEGNLHRPRGYHIFKHENEYRIGILLNDDKKEALPVTIIAWNDADSDTVKCRIKRTANTKVCDMVWLNEELVWEAYETERFIEIVK